MKNLGLILLFVGLIGLVFFGYQVYQDSESFNVLGHNVAVSKADWLPVILFALVALIGYVFMKRKR